MNSQQPIDNGDIDEAIKAYTNNPSFLKKILEGSKTRKKVENFLSNQQMMAMHDYQKDPELYKTAKEIFETPGYDPETKAEAKRQLDLMDAGLPRFPKA